MSQGFWGTPLWRVLALAWLGLSSSVSAAEMPERRFAISVGHNVGAADHAPLRFAQADAARFADTLSELGGFAPEDVVVLEQPSLARLRAALGELEKRLVEAGRSRGRRTMLLFYWSGHATDRGLEFGSELLPFPELKRLLARSSADVRLGFVDACRSGGLVAPKGARANAQGFALDVLAEQSPDGTAIFASSGPQENALESAELRGGFFTHHLTAGLRGAADVDSDGRVTLQEAYRYAYARTLAQSVEVSGVAQRPTYALELKGKGEVVLSVLERAQGHLVFAARPQEGVRWLVVRDEGSGEVMELRDDPERPRRLALRAGRYRLVRATADDVRVGTFTLSRGQELHASAVPLGARPYSVAVAKGEDAAGQPLVAGAQVLLAAGLGSPRLRGAHLTPALLVGARFTARTGERLLLRASYQEGSGLDAGLPYFLRGVGLDAAVLWDLPWTGVSAGARVGAERLSQRIAGLSAGSGTRGRLGAVLSLHFPLFARAGGFLESEAHAATFKLNDALVVRPGFELSTGLTHRFW